MKEQTGAAMASPDGPIKLLFATEAYSLGADAPNVRRIVHVGPPGSLESKFSLFASIPHLSLL